ncbi:hypothetical protein RIF29_03854 [Crotalaria pallida]|uniref:Uncharacterized protein n=1 Tax=Crotalaria pallida TaxID=3830 RepID=A0AAN9J1A6_CROPI
MSLKGNNESTTFVSPVPSIPGRLRIPNVQEMVKREAWRVPEIYIRNNIDMGNAIRMHHLSPQIPIIDLAMLRNGSKEELLKLDMACKDWGFFQKWSNERYKSVEHRVVANKTKVRSVHEVILMPSIEKMVEPNTVGDLVNRYLQRR